MKISIKISQLLLVVFFLAGNINAQDNLFTKKYKEEVITTLSQLMNDYYVLPDIAKKTEEHLLKQLSDGDFDQFENDKDFAEALTISVQAINKDKHMRITKNPPYTAPVETPERLVEEKLYNLKRKRDYNNGFHTIKVLEGNVGYLDLRGFTYFHEGKIVADAYMKLVENTDAMIIDLSQNGGGDPAMVQYLCSYFFDKKVHLNSLYFRERDETIEFWSLDEINGKKRSDVPLFIITGKKTFSGAEEFSYNMQTQKRATLIGQTTGGGANPGTNMPINQNLTVFIPTGMAINPITKTNWEGVGVIPEVKTEVGAGLEKAHEMAKLAAVTYREKRNEDYTKMLMELNGHLETYVEGVSEELILKTLKQCEAAGIIQEWETNLLGYDYLMEKKKINIAKAIFKANTILHPESANVFDSYGESLMMDGDYEKSLENYQKAVDNAIKSNAPDVEMYKENLQKIKDKIAKEK